MRITAKTSLALVGIVAVSCVVAVAIASKQLACGHAESVGSLVLSRLGVLSSEHLPVAEAVHRWNTTREGDFDLIVRHVHDSPGLLAKPLGVPDERTNSPLPARAVSKPRGRAGHVMARWFVWEDEVEDPDREPREFWYYHLQEERRAVVAVDRHGRAVWASVE